MSIASRIPFERSSSRGAGSLGTKKLRKIESFSQERRHHERCVAWRRSWRGRRELDITRPYRTFRRAAVGTAHCHLGLGRLYRRTGNQEEAREHLTTATTMYREMGMTYWWEQAEAEMKESA